MRLGQFGEFGRSGFWLRLWRNGPGVVALPDSNEPLFSERHGYRRFYSLWPGWRFRIVWGRR